jgi:hypothetical protein
MLAFRVLLNAACFGFNGYWFYRSLKNPSAFPLWYKAMTGFFTIWCGMAFFGSL